MRDGAGVSRLLRGSALGSGGIGIASDDACGTPAVRRVGSVSGEAKPPRPGLNRSGVRLWAATGLPSSTVSSRHGKAARKAYARLLRPLPGGDPTVEILQQNQLLRGQTPANKAGPIVNGVKTIMVNDPLRVVAAASPHGRGHAKEATIGQSPTSPDRSMPSSKPLMTQSSGPIPASVESALRTLETESGGI